MRSLSPQPSPGAPATRSLQLGQRPHPALAPPCPLSTRSLSERRAGKPLPLAGVRVRQRAAEPRKRLQWNKAGECAEEGGGGWAARGPRRAAVGATCGPGPPRGSPRSRCSGPCPVARTRPAAQCPRVRASPRSPRWLASRPAPSEAMFAFMATVATGPTHLRGLPRGAAGRAGAGAAGRGGTGRPRAGSPAGQSFSARSSTAATRCCSPPLL